MTRSTGSQRVWHDRSDLACIHEYCILYVHRRICFIKKQTLWNILAKTFQAFSQKLPNICMWQDSHFIKDLFLFFLSGRPTTTFEILRKAETWHSWHLLEFRMSSLSATKFWIDWKPPLQTCQISVFLGLFLHWSPVAYWVPTPGQFIFQCPIFLPLHTVHGILKARILKWFAIPFSSGPHFVRTLHHDPSDLGGPTQHGS